MSQSLHDYRKLSVAERIQLDELEAIRAYDAAMATGGEAVSFSDAVREIESRRSQGKAP
jgi:hypothetical protein